MMPHLMMGVKHGDSVIGANGRDSLLPPPTGLEASIPINMVIAQLTQQTSEMYGMIREMHTSMTSNTADCRVGIPKL